MAEHKPDAIAHLAAMARGAVQHGASADLWRSERAGSLNLIDAARLAGRPALRAHQHRSVYGSSTPVPFREDAAADRPLAPYPASKRSMELMAHSHHHLFKLPMTIVRFFNVYGPHAGRTWCLALVAEDPERQADRVVEQRQDEARLDLHRRHRRRFVARSITIWI